MKNVKTMHLFAGVGGGLLADLIMGHDPIVAVEWDKYACSVLRQRAADGWFPNLRVWEGDVRLFDPSEYAGSVDCIHAGFPCQDISIAGKQAGVSEGTRSGLYREVLRIAGIVRPRYLFLENVAAILGNGLATVLADVAAMGYDCRWLCIRASDVGAPHHRDRWFCLCHSQHSGLNAAEVAGSPAQGGNGDEAREKQTGEPARSSDAEVLADTSSKRLQRGEAAGCPVSNREESRNQLFAGCSFGIERAATKPGLGELADGLPGRLGWWDSEPEVGRVSSGVKNRVGQLKGYGNAQVPMQAAIAWKLLGGE